MRALELLMEDLYIMKVRCFYLQLTICYRYFGSKVDFSTPKKLEFSINSKLGSTKSDIHEPIQLHGLLNGITEQAESVDRMHPREF